MKLSSFTVSVAGTVALLSSAVRILGSGDLWVSECVITYHKIQPARIVAASAVRWSFVQGGPIVARGPCRTSSARSASMLAA